MDEFRIDPTIAYDIVELPSRGIYYPNKKKSLKVAYLSGPDENILASPNLAQSGEIVNELLKRKIIDRDIKFEDIVEEDRQAVLIFLRNTSWGPEYKLNGLIDPKTNETFETTIDLSILKIKDFNLVEDVNGEYPYFMEKSRVPVTFKFLTKQQEDESEKMKTSWNGNGIAPVVSKPVELMIKSVNGNRDMMEIHNFIERIPIKDQQDFRKYVKENKPGLDLIQQVLTPSGEYIQVYIGFGVEFFRPFYGL
jgi:hypothetical protein